MANTTKTAEQIAQEQRSKTRAAARRAAQRGYQLGADTIKCALCEYEAHSLVTHIKSAHAMDLTAYEEAAGLALGTAVVISPSLQARFKEAGAKGAAKLAEKKAAQSANG